MTIRCQKVESGLPALFSKLLANLTGRKTEYLIANSSEQGFDEKFLDTKYVLEILEIRAFHNTDLLLLAGLVKYQF